MFRNARGRVFLLFMNALFLILIAGCGTLENGRGWGITSLPLQRHGRESKRTVIGFRMFLQGVPSAISSALSSMTGLWASLKRNAFTLKPFPCTGERCLHLPFPLEKEPADLHFSCVILTLRSVRASPIPAVSRILELARP